MFLLYPAQPYVCSKIRCMHIKRPTLIELVVGIVLLAATVAFAWSQTQVFAARDRDIKRKTDINSIDGYLVSVYFPKHRYYPIQLVADQLPGLNPKYLVGPKGAAINTPSSLLHYDPLDCTNGQCAGYTLRTNLEQEADYIVTRG